MGGLEALPEIHRKHPGLPVIIYSHLTAPAATATLQALALGATEFALKPRADGIGLAEESIRVELLPLIRACLAKDPRRRPTVRFGNPVEHVGIQVGSVRPDDRLGVVIDSHLPEDGRIAQLQEHRAV